MNELETLLTICFDPETRLMMFVCYCIFLPVSIISIVLTGVLNRRNNRASNFFDSIGGITLVQTLVFTVMIIGQVIMNIIDYMQRMGML